MKEVDARCVCAAHKPAHAIAYWMEVDSNVGMKCDRCEAPTTAVYFTERPG